MTTVVNGLLLGSNYALLAVGYTLVFGVMHLLTLAHGQVFIASGVGAALIAQAGAPLWLAAVAAIAIGAALSVTTDIVSFRPVGYARPIAAAVSTIGFALIIETTMKQVRSSANAVAFPGGFAAFDVTVGGTLISLTNVAALVVAGLAMVATTRFVNGTKWGTAMRAFAQDPEAVALLGVPTRRLVTLTLATAGALAGVAVMLQAVRTGAVNPQDGFGIGLIGLAAMTIGGLGSIRGALIAGLLLGVVTTVLEPVELPFDDAVPWVALLAVLVVRPSGLFGPAER